jgi:transcriptional regulator with XRE-family HTH domain
MQTVTKVRDLSPNEERIRENLVRFIAESGYTQNAIADMSGVPQASLGRYIRGENAVPADALPMLSEVFGRSIADFFAIDPPPADIESAAPVFIRQRPGVTWTAEDQHDADEFLQKLRARRAKKKVKK